MLEIDLDGPEGSPHWLSKPVKKDYDESEHPRDESGKWTAGGVSWHAPSADVFIAARNRGARPDFFSPLEPKDLKNYKLIMTPDGGAGAAVAPDGDIQNAFRNPDAPKGSGSKAVTEAVRHGGLMLDAYDYDEPGKPGLPDIYRKVGFVETGRMKFNPAYRPHWPANKTPDVVFMAYVGGDQSNSPKSDHYYSSTAWDRAKKDSLARADAPGESDVARQLREQRERRGKPTIPLEVDRALHGLGKSDGYEAESEKIKRNKMVWGRKTHRFLAAEWTHPNGHPRCVRCGAEESMDGLCMPGLEKWERMLEVWTQKYTNEFNAKIELRGFFMPERNWITDFHSKCIAKSEACSVKWPVCPVGKSDTVAKYITGGNGSFKVHAESGKVLGTHATRGEAEAQLRAIEAHKHGTSNQKNTDPVAGQEPVFTPDPTAMKALQTAFRAYAKSEGLVYKAEEIHAEPVEANVFRVDNGRGGKVYFRVTKSETEQLSAYHQRGQFLPVMKADKQRYTLGAVYAPGETDYHGDTMTEQELEKAAWTFARKDGLTKRIGLMHQAGTEGAADVVESYIYRGPVWKFKDSAGIEQTIVPGTWMLGAVWQPEGWAKVERGVVKGWSLQGVARKFANGEEV